MTDLSHAELYGQLRASLLSRHFAINRHFRTNFLYHTNVIQQAGNAGAFLNENKAAQMQARWNVQFTSGNPLLISGMLLTCLAVEYSLGQPNALKIIRLALGTLASLFKFQSSDDFRGYITRWDAVTSDRWQVDAATGTPLFCEEFLIGQDNTYLYCIPFDDPRYVPPGASGRDAFVTTYREAEPSADELVGLLSGYDMVFRLVPDPDVRASVQTQLRWLGSYLATHGYLLVRPCGGFTAQGASGVLPAMEFCFGQIFERITGDRYAAQVDFQGAMEKAGLWGSVEEAVSWWSALVVAIPDSLLMQIIGPALQGLLAGFGIDTPAGFSSLQLARSFAIYTKADVFDVIGQNTEFALACLLMEAEPRDRFISWVASNAHLSPAKKIASQNFLPYIGMSGLDDPDDTVINTFLNWLGQQLVLQNEPPPIDKDYDPPPVARCLTLAVGAMFGNPDSEARLIARLEENRSYINNLFQSDLAILDADRTTEDYRPALDYMSGLALAWLLRSRRAAAGTLENNSLLPESPDPLAWPTPVVQSDIIKAVRDGNLVLPLASLQRQPVPIEGISGAAVFLEADPPHKPSDPIPVLPFPQGDPVLVAEVRISVSEREGAVDTGIDLQPGDEYEITAGGEIEKNGPDGSEDIVYDNAFPVHSPCNGHAFQLIGRLGSNFAWFPIGRFRARQAWMGFVPRRLYLGVNDDRPRNGSGSFTCQVRVWRRQLTRRDVSPYVDLLLEADEPRP